MARERRFILSKHPDGQIEDIERALQRLAGKMIPTSTVIIPPFPVSAAFKTLPIDGELFRSLFIMEGVIVNISVMCEDLQKDTSPSISISVIDAKGISKTTSIPLKKGSLTINPETYIPSGSRVIITIDKPDAVSGLWLSALMEPTLDKSAKHALVIDDLADNVERIISDARATTKGAIE